jgi:uncharacterized protein
MKTMRRSDRAIAKEEALRLLEGGEWGVLSTVGSNNQPYGMPLSYCILGDCLYFHSAIEGHKIDNVAHNPMASFCVVGKTHVLPSKFSTEYESTIVFGQVHEALGDEKQKALEGLLRKYSPEFLERGLKYIQVESKTTRVYGLSLETVTGKARRRIPGGQPKE